MNARRECFVTQQVFVLKGEAVQCLIHNFCCEKGKTNWEETLLLVYNSNKSCMSSKIRYWDGGAYDVKIIKLVNKDVFMYCNLHSPLNLATQTN